MKVREIMTPDVEVVHPDDTLQAAAQKMRDRDVGSLPVCDGEKLIGMLTDRDITVRAVAEGRQPSDIIGRDLVTSPVIYCFDDDDVKHATEVMREHQIRRLPIISRQGKRLVGMVATRDIALNTNDETSGKVLQDVSEH